MIVPPTLYSASLIPDGVTPLRKPWRGGPGTAQGPHRGWACFAVAALSAHWGVGSCRPCQVPSLALGLTLRRHWAAHFCMCPVHLPSRVPLSAGCGLSRGNHSWEPPGQAVRPPTALLRGLPGVPGGLLLVWRWVAYGAFRFTDRHVYEFLRGADCADRFVPGSPPKQMTVYL